MQVTYDALGPTLRGPLPNEDFDLQITQVPTYIDPVSSGIVQEKDATLQTSTVADSDNNFQVYIPEGGEIENETPSICSVSVSGLVSRIANGQASIVLHVPGLGAKRYRQDLIRSGAGVSSVSCVGYQAGSLRKFMNDQMDAICNHVSGILGGSPTVQQYSDYQRHWADDTPWDGTAAGGAVNAGHMSALTGVSGFSPFDMSLVGENSVWLSRRHNIRGIGAAHGVYPGANEIGVGGDQIMRYYATDQVPLSSVVKLLPSNYRTYLPQHYGASCIQTPVWWRGFHTYIGAYLDPTARRYWTMPAQFTYGSLAPVTVGPAAQFSRALGTPLTIGRGGDSGSPVFCAVQEPGQPTLTPVFLGRMYLAGGGCDWYHDMLTEINTKMNDLAGVAQGTYATLTADLSGYTTYP